MTFQLSFGHIIVYPGQVAVPAGGLFYAAHYMSRVVPQQQWLQIVQKVVEGLRFIGIRAIACDVLQK